MTTYSKKFFLLLFIAAAMTSTVLGQNARSNGNSAAPALLPFAVGETLTYEGKMRKSISPGIAIADLTFTVTRPDPDGDFVVKADARRHLLASDKAACGRLNV